MKRIALLLSVLALALITAAPAFAEHNNEHGGGYVVDMPGDQCPDPEFPRETPDGCQASTLPDVEFGSSAEASASAPAAAEYQYAPDEQYQAPASPDIQELPATGGFNLPLFLGVVLLIGGIIGASQLYLRHRRNQ